MSWQPYLFLYIYFIGNWTIYPTNVISFTLIYLCPIMFIKKLGHCDMYCESRICLHCFFFNIFDNRYYDSCFWLICLFFTCNALFWFFTISWSHFASFWFLADLTFQIQPIAITICHLYVCVCTTLYRTVLNAHASYVENICTYITHMCTSYMWHIWHICLISLAHFVSGTYFAITCGIDIVAGIFMQTFGSICLHGMLAMWAIFGIWQPYLFSDICQICVQWYLQNCP